MNGEALMEIARKARGNAYVPYSHFAVGAALLSKDGKVYTGCNVENAAYGPTNCAERTAFFKAVSEGARGFEAIAIAGGPEEGAPMDGCSPCGVCRQVMLEFCDDDFLVYLEESGGVKKHTLGELMPMGFRADKLG